MKKIYQHSLVRLGTVSDLSSLLLGLGGGPVQLSYRKCDPAEILHSRLAGFLHLVLEI